ncbi:N-acetyltransferase [Mesorhizobium microcysteis]|uniref:N-acetyltransferase n=1 Tax=Neoaquamicrobium microcysteis TaxID=2682781 RepID=A0A5D4H639_9HYPH|nr:GNAT family N-acetyltransferase [Mesorhizobium microcysteis]TYR34915.1 N-acetyltransferase [Mesorhizobium microcysteis]
MNDFPIQLETTEKGGRYFVPMPNGDDARLTFVRVSDTHWIADHTFVPVPWRGQGIAERMVERLVADARQAGATITPTCWFVADELQRMSPAWDDVRRG